ncbi:GNAT family N-acetyltransferase [Streptomyces antimicrobicus]|uniref:GNAT family N-acetyltransferase n=1 Tax=Streptomyces antimicrobicus TaxID=2883108 RepID=A0ABS8BD24_9ACTN|nr:GNAT family protein [Streptomyces antimicrobicus]MCB5182416.1 GNAT family N-acetyltransferase [Streptomyces antimicrobicus]
MTAAAPLTLRTFRPADDSPFLHRWVTSRAELIRWAGPAFRWPLDDAQVAAYAAEPGRHAWSAVADPAGDPLGHVSLLRHPDGSGARLGRVLIAPEARGRGLGEAMLRQVLDRAFGELDLPAVDLGVYTHNTAAVRLYERLGFRTEAVLADVEEVDGEPWSALQMRLRRPPA